MISQIKYIAIPYLKQPQKIFKNILWRLPKSRCDKEIVFVMGAPRSGTTLIQKVLEAHEEFFSIQGETGLFSLQNIFDPNRKHFGLDQELIEKLLDESNDIVDFFDKSVSQMNGYKEGKVFIEKTPQHAIHLTKLLKYFPAAKFINIVRDGRDCYSSAKKHMMIPQRGSVNRYAKYWKKCVSPAITNVDNERVFVLKYEEFTADPVQACSDLMGFLGKSFQPNQIDPKYYGDDVRATSVNFQRLNDSISSKSVDRWKNDLSDNEKNIFKRLAMNELSYFGYNV